MNTDRLAKVKRIWVIMNATNRGCIDDDFQSPFILSDEDLDAIYLIIKKYEDTYLDDTRFKYKGYEPEE